MTPETISERETKFALKLVDSSAKQFTAGNKIRLSDDYTITPISTSFKSYYYQTKTEKKQICLHFTVGMLTGDIATLTKENNHMSVQYVVDRLGFIYRLFPDEYWSYHLGSTAIGGNTVMSKQSIGIEISNYGPLRLKDDKYVDAYGNTYTMDSSLVEPVSYRGYDYYAKMTIRQKEAVARLLVYLSEKHNIPLVFKEGVGEVFKTAEEAVAYRGIFCHSNVRTDKFDLPPEMTLQIKDTLESLIRKPKTRTPLVADEKPAEEPKETQKSEEPKADAVPEKHDYHVEENKNGEPVIVDKAVAAVATVAQVKTKTNWIRRILGILRRFVK